MPSINSSNAKYHCRTCLDQINVEDTQETTRNPERVDLLQNVAIRELIHKNICSKYEFCEDPYPQIICLKCFNELQQFQNFLLRALKNAEKLKGLIEQRRDVKCPNFGIQDETSKDMYDLMLKGNLMETESVLLEPPATISQANEENENPDPFSKSDENHREGKNSNGEESNDGNHIWQHQPSTDNDSNGDNNENIESSMEENKVIISIEKPTTRMRTLRSKTKGSIKEQNSILYRKKQQVKKDIRELKSRGSERKNNKPKRREKGTKNNFKCEKCFHCFAHKITLDAHIRKIHEGSKRPFKCDRCDKYYTFIGGLYTHIKEVHEAKTRSYECSYPNCKRTYTSFIAMQKHVRLKHTDIGEQKKYVCEQCGATFKQIGNLKYHRRTKHPTEDEKAEKERNNQRFECNICNKLFFSRYTLKYHTQQLHTNDTKYECKVCGRRMAKKFMLAQHMLVHSTEKMPCEQCGKQFIRKFELESHIRAVHMKIKPYECQYCSECFASRKTLKHHEYIHTGEKPYVCNICGQAYRQQTCLKNHKKSHEKPSNEILPSANEKQSATNSIQTLTDHHSNVPEPSVVLKFETCSAQMETA